jgi:hypothetical protein
MDFRFHDPFDLDKWCDQDAGSCAGLRRLRTPFDHDDIWNQRDIARVVGG